MDVGLVDEDSAVSSESGFDDVFGESPPASRDGGGVSVFDPRQVAVEELADAHVAEAVGEPDAFD